jgi:hypothetical protein
MAQRFLGAPITIHGGGMDLVFPHHDSEIAQAEGVSILPIALSDSVAALQVIERSRVVGQNPVLGLLADAVHLSEHRDSIELA